MLYTGVVENRTDDPLKLGRCQVRILGLHSPDKLELPTSDLPWAIVMQSTDSAAMSGIGRSPTGFVEGTLVAVFFRDEHKQQPIIIGSFGGIPEPFKDQKVGVMETAESTAWSTAEGTVVKQVSEGKLSPTNKTVKKPTSALVISEDAYTFIRNEEACSSKVQGSNKYCRFTEYQKMADSTTFYAYQDIRGIWTVGWGNTYLKDGSRVVETTKLNKTEVESLMRYWADSYAKELAGSIRAPITQSMFDCLVSMMYNVGPSIKKSSIIASINAGDYAGAASQITVYKNLGGKLTERRNREKAFFSKDGFPNKDMSAVEDAPEEITPTVDDASENPVVDVKDPVTAQKMNMRSVDGFRDPNGVYPKIFNEPDTHRLARSEKIDQTIVYAKEAARAKGVVSGGNGKWSQPKIPYNAQYPYNHVRVTESGHVQEFDDTKGSERIHTYHRSGTFSEIDTNGTRVNRIVGDDYEIMERNGNVLIRGSLNVTIIGNQNIRIENDANIDVLGNLNMTVGGDFNLGATGNVNIAAGADIMMTSAGNTSIDAALLFENSGKAKSIPLGKGSAGGLPEFPTLTVPTRNDETESQYETPDDGDAAEYEAKLESAGITDTLDTDTSDGSTSDSVDEEPKKEPVVASVTDCSMIPQTGAIDMGFVLSKSFKLKDLNGSRLSVPPVVSATKAEIVCNLKTLAEQCLEPIKKKYPSMNITSGYRNSVPAGGSTRSDHLYGCAADIQIGGFNRAQHYEATLEIVKMLGAWTQVIFETRGSSTWIHISYNPKRGLRMEKFSMANDKRISPDMFTIVPQG